MSSTQAAPMPIPVVLPSIHEMFPEHLMKIPPHIRIERISQRGRMPSHHSRSSDYLPPTSSPPGRRRHSTASDTSFSSPRLPHMHMHHASRASIGIPPTNPASYRPTSRDRHVNPRARNPFSTSDSPIFSFDVLRSDPSSSSLQHIASSATFHNRGGSSAGYNPQGEVSNGSAPAFRVSVPDASSVSRGGERYRTSRASHDPTDPVRKVQPTRVGKGSPDQGYSTIISFPVAGSGKGQHAGRDHSPEDPDTGSDDGDLSASSGKKHICSTCLKRFNRPSSLRIHVNTHTGATPFRCPWPDCGREFNVNSNMRRHYRNHTTPGFSRPQTNDTRRRRRRGQSNGLIFVGGNASPTMQRPGSGSSMTPPISSLSMDDDSDEDLSDVAANDGFQDEEEDELDSLPDESVHTSRRPYSRSSDLAESHSYERTTFNRYSQSHMRSANPNLTSSCRSRSSSSPTPPLPGVATSVHQDRIYNPSPPYVRSFTDSRVSTALRPAFHSKSIVRTEIKDEPMSDAW
ncbi:C2H2 finger domain transcription factor mtfA [Hypsizygus marmoreus]|uniref:C2H2 finger domain transcription factor mtfA n=1 Tax=Hypsizygus marmoreus TaxID=39966 RepID=A0A369K9I8_HYPMA|nr:C2H2 finger domain transcription factor mtfA [Hypsizygus marmoreus]